MPGPLVTTVKLSTTTFTADIAPEYAALAPKEELLEIVLSPTERAFLWVGGRVVAYLNTGRHFVWNIDASTRVERVDTAAPLLAPLDKAQRASVSVADYTDVTVREGAVGLRFEDGKLVEELAPGKYAAWKTLRDVSFVVLDRRAQVQSIAA